MSRSILPSGPCYYKRDNEKGIRHAVLLLNTFTSKCWSHSDTLKSAGWLEFIVARIDVAGSKADALSRDFTH